MVRSTSWRRRAGGTVPCWLSQVEVEFQVRPEDLGRVASALPEDTQRRPMDDKPGAARRFTATFTSVHEAACELIYLGDGQLLSYRPDEEDLRATERLVEALWRAIEEANAAREWLPSPGASCRWCSYQEHCPAFGNQPPPLPEAVAAPD